MLEVLLGNLDLFLFLLFVVLGYSCGTIAEKRHYKSIIKREKELIKLMLVNVEGRFADGAVNESFLVRQYGGLQRLLQTATGDFA